MEKFKDQGNLANKIAEWKKQMESKSVIPKDVIIETVFGCNANCTMCPIDKPSERKKGVMPNSLFRKIIDDLEPYKLEISQMDLFGVGEPLLDKDFPEKIKYAKNSGFANVGFATNAHLLEIGLAEKVFKAGVNTIMLSVDGTTKEVHESIRLNTDYDKIVGNVKSAIKLRDQENYKAKFVLRFIRQPKNQHQWDDYCKFWNDIISEKRGDIIVGYDMHTWGGEIEIPVVEGAPTVADDLACHHIFDRMIILRDGSVPLCCADMHHAHLSLGNVYDSSPIEIYNSKAMQKYREQHINGKRLNMKICDACTILESEEAKEIKKVFK